MFVLPTFSVMAKARFRIPALPIIVAYLLIASCDTGVAEAGKGTPSAAVLDSVKAETSAVHPASVDSSSFSIPDLFKSENSDVVNTIADENFALAEKKARKYLSSSQTGLSPTQMANLRYMHLYAMSGLATLEKKQHADVRALLEKYQGQSLITQHLPVTDQPGQPFNQIRVEQDSPDTISVTCSNREGFNIICFVRVGMKKRPDLKGLVGKRAYLMGNLESFMVSAQSINSWIFDMTLGAGELHVLGDDFGH